MSTDMKLIMENWRRFQDNINDEDLEIVNNSFVYLKKNKKQLLESKNDSPYQRKIKFSEFINLVENRKINIYTAQKMILDTIEIDGKVLDQQMLEEAMQDKLQAVGQAVKQGAQAVGQKVKQGAQAVGQAVQQGAQAVKNIVNLAWEKVKQFILKSVMSLIATATNLIGKLTFDSLINKPYKQLARFMLQWQVKIYNFFQEPKVKKIIRILVTVYVIIVVCAAVTSLINTVSAMTHITDICSGMTENYAINEAYLFEAGGVCQMAANMTQAEIAEKTVTDQDCLNEFLGNVAKANEGLKSERVSSDIQFQSSGTGMPTVSIDDVSMTSLSDQVTTDTVNLVQDLTELRDRVGEEDYLRLAIKKNTVFAKYIQKWINFRTEDPELQKAMQSAGENANVFNKSLINSKLEVSTSQTGSSYFEKILRMSSTHSTDTIMIRK